MLNPRSVQVHRLLTHWAQRGCEIHVVCGAPETAVWSRWDYELQERYPDLIRYLRVPSPEKKPIHMLARWAGLPVERLPDSQGWWVGKARKAGLEAIEGADFDVILSFGKPMSGHLVCLGLKKQTGLPWVAHFSDPWVDNPYDAYQGFARAMNTRLERNVVSHADQVVFVSAETQDLVMQKYPSEWRIKTHVIPHYFDPCIYPEPGSRNSKMVFRHIGTFYGHRTPEPLFQALCILKSQDTDVLKGVQFEMIGHCHPPSLIDHLLTAFNLQDCVAVQPLVPYVESLKLMVEGDVLVLIDAPIIDPNVFLPSKLVDYLGAGRALLGITPLRGPSADLIQRSGGIVVDPRDTEGIARAIYTYIQEYKADTLLQKRVPNDTLRGAYELTTVARHFYNVLENA